MNRLMMTVAGAACAAIALAAAPAMAQQKTLTISWWGYNGEKMDANIIQPFKQICGCEIVFETGNNADRLNKLKARGGKGVDVIYLTDSYSQLGIEDGLFQKIDPSRLPNLEGLYDLAKDPHEVHNLAGESAHARLLDEMQAKLKAFQKETNDPWILKWDYE